LFKGSILLFSVSYQKSLDLNKGESSFKAVFTKREVSFSLSDFLDTFGLLVGGELPSEGTGQLGSGEDSALD